MQKHRVLIVAKTRRGAGACIGAITADGRSVRLEAADAATNERAGLEYAVGDVWEVEAEPPATIKPPHVENVVVFSKRRVALAANPIAAIERLLPPKLGAIDLLYEGLAQATTGGALYIAERTGIPPYSTCFWRPDQALTIDTSGKRIRYRYPTPDGGRTLTFVGFQEPVAETARPAPYCASRLRTGGVPPTPEPKSLVATSSSRAGFYRPTPCHLHPNRTSWQSLVAPMCHLHSLAARTMPTWPAPATYSKMSSASTTFVLFRRKSLPASWPATTRLPSCPPAAVNRSATNCPLSSGTV